MEKITKEQAIIISAYTGTLCCEFSDMHEEIEKRLNTPVFTHQLGNKDFVREEVQPAFKKDFLAMMP